MLVKLLHNDGLFDVSKGKRISFDEDLERNTFLEKCYLKLTQEIPNAPKKSPFPIKLFYKDGEPFHPSSPDEWEVFIESCKIMQSKGLVLQLVVELGAYSSSYIPPKSPRLRGVRAKPMRNSESAMSGKNLGHGSKASVYEEAGQNAAGNQPLQNSKEARAKRHSFGQLLMIDKIVRQQSLEYIDVDSQMPSAISGGGFSSPLVSRENRSSSVNLLTATNHSQAASYEGGESGTSSSYHHDTFTPCGSPAVASFPFHSKNNVSLTPQAAHKHANAAQPPLSPSYSFNNTPAHSRCGFCQMSFQDPRHPISKCCSLPPSLSSSSSSLSYQHPTHPQHAVAHQSLGSNRENSSPHHFNHYTTNRVYQPASFSHKPLRDQAVTTSDLNLREFREDASQSLPCSFCLNHPEGFGMRKRCPICLPLLLPHLDKEERETVLKILNA